MACILLVEDEAEIRLMLAEVLVDAGHAVVEADSGDAAALLLEGNADFDVLVTDITMPGQLDGIGLAKRFRMLHSHRPILYVTGRPDALRHTPLRPDREAALVKPYGLLMLVTTVQTMLAAVPFGADDGPVLATPPAGVPVAARRLSNMPAKA